MKSYTRKRRRLIAESLEPRLLLTVPTAILSEISAINNETLFDEDGDSSDWLEIHNPGSAELELDGWYLTDDSTDLMKWQFPAASIDPGGYLVVFASDKDRRVAGDQLHTNFMLDGNGEYLALVEPDGVTVVSAFAPEFPEQEKDFTYGFNLNSNVTSLVTIGDTATVLVPNAADDGAIGQTWTGGDEPFDDGSWTSGPTGIGFSIDAAIPTDPVEEATYVIPANTNGSQAFGGALGMDFIVNREVSVTELGAFDDGSNGMNRTITVQLWSRNDAGSPGLFNDDTGISVLAMETFTPAGPGTLEEGSRFKPLATPLTLAPGAYTIVAYGYGATERNGNVGVGGASIGTVAAVDGTISYVGNSRYGNSPGLFPNVEDGGPANRYGAGTFKIEYVPGAVSSLELVNPSFENPPQADHTSANGFPFTNNLAGWFQSGVAAGAGIWNPADIQFSGATDQIPDPDTTIPDGKNIAFINSGFIHQTVGAQLQANRTYTLSGHFAGRIDGAESAFEMRLLAGNTVVGSVAGTALVDQWVEHTLSVSVPADHPALDEQLRIEIEKTGAAQLEVDQVNLSADPLFATNIEMDMHEVNASAYVRTPFAVGDTSDFDRLRLKIRYDDGFVAYLNGTEVARRNAPSPLTWESTALAARPDEVIFDFETIDISSHLTTGTLQANQTNVLAIHGLNVMADDDDFVVAPVLEAVQLLDVVAGYYETATPGAPNSPIFGGFVGDTTFSVDRGFYAASDLELGGVLADGVTITTDTPGASIVYTTDGSEPNLTNGTLVIAADADTPPVAVVPITTTTTLRAAALKEGLQPSNVDAHTYLFLDDVLQQPLSPVGFPSSWGGATGDYQMDPDVINDPVYGPQMLDALRSLPTMSLVMNVDDLFDPTRGIYYNSTNSGRAWERPVSVEYFDPNDSEAGFQVNAGIRVAGEASRVDSESMKKSFRLYFRDEYGPGKLNYTLFPDSAVSQFDKLQLRAHFGDGWTVPREHPKDSSFVRDMWTRRSALEMGLPAPNGNDVHLYINGLYWGIYNPTERPDEDYASDHFGGTQDQWDVIRPGKALSGDFEAWNEMFAIANAGLSSSEAYQQIQEYLDVENLIDYMILNIYAYNQDWFGGSKNMFAIRPRVDGGKFRFVPWDSEHVWSIIGINRPLDTNISADYNSNSSPARLYNQLRANSEFRLLFADRVQQHMFHGGPLTDQAVADRWLAQAAIVEDSIIPESARWGDSKPPYTSPILGGGPMWTSPLGQDDVLFEQNRLLTQVFPGRTQIVLNQFQALGLYPGVDAAQFSIDGQPLHGGEVGAGAALTMVAPSGTIYYTLDGSDPRQLTNIATTVLLDEFVPATALVPAAAADEQDGAGQMWFEPGFVESAGWASGSTGVGYERIPDVYDGLINLDVSEMDGGNNSVFIRIPFDIPDQATLDGIDTLTLDMKYDDGFKAYLNGVSVAEINAPMTIAWDSAATGDHPDSAAVGFESFAIDLDDLAAGGGQLVVGQNVLAIQGLNNVPGAPSSDLLVLPRLVAGETMTGDGLSPSAIQYDGTPIVLTATTQVRARVVDGDPASGTWSASSDATFVVNPATAGNLAITEIHYNPSEPTAAELADHGNLDNDDFEFVEVQNTSSQTISLFDVQFTEGVDFTFPSVELGAGEKAVVVRDAAAFQLRYGDGITVFGEFDEGGLNNDGERLTLVDASGATIVDMEYRDNDPWPERADGVGATLELIDAAGTATGEFGKHYRWRGSTEFGGTPGTDGVGPIGVAVNEVLAHTDPPLTHSDSIELYNTTASAIDLSGWFLSDSAIDLFKFEIPSGTILGPDEYLVYDESDFNPTPLDPGPGDFALSGASGDDVWLIDPSGTGGIGAFVDDVHFAASPNGETFGRLPDGTGRLVPNSRITLGCGNSHARVGPLVISEVAYNPGEPSPAALAIDPNLTEDDLEFVEVHNPTDASVDLTDWRLRGGVDIDFPAGTMIGASETIVLISFSPQLSGNVDRLNAFRAHYGINETTRLLGVYAGQLSDSGESVRFQRPDQPPLEQPTLIPRLVEDEVLYDDRPPWATTADGLGDSLQRNAPVYYGNDALSWRAATPTPGAVDFGGNVPGDLTGEGVVTGNDIDVLFDAINAGSTVTYFDLDANNIVDSQDVRFLVEGILGSPFGDANLDGAVDGSDFNIWNVHKFQPCNKAWATGDFSGDGKSDGSDFGIWNTHKFTVGVPAAAANDHVPRTPLSVPSVPVEAVQDLRTNDHSRLAPGRQSFRVVDRVLRDGLDADGERAWRAGTAPLATRIADRNVSDRYEGVRRGATHARETTEQPIVSEGILDQVDAFFASWSDKATTFAFGTHSLLSEKD